MAAFGLNDEVIKQFGLNDEEVGQGAVTKPAIPGGQAALVTKGHSALAAKTSYTPQNPQFDQAPSMSEDMAPGMNMGTRTVQNYSDRQMQAAKQGVNIDAGGDIDTARANFSITEEGRNARIANEIKQTKGPNTPIRYGENSLSGDVEWYDKDAKQWKTVGNSLGGKAVNAIPATTEAIGGIGGAFLPAPGISSVLGAAGGRALGVAIKNSIGLSLGDNVKEDPLKASDPFEEGLVSAASTAVGNTLLAGVPGTIRMAVRGKDVVNPAQARSIIDSYNANSKYVDQINASMKGVTDKRMEPNIAGIASIPDAAGQVNANAVNLNNNRKLLLNTTPALAQREVTRRVNNENVVELYWTNEIQNPSAVPNLTQENWQSRVKQAYDDYKDVQLGPYQKQADQAVQQAEQAAQAQPQMGQLNKTKMGQIVRKVIQKASDESKDQETAAWANYQDLAGYVPDKIESSLKVPVTKEIETSISALKGLKKQALLDSQKSQADRYTLNLKDPASEEDSALLGDFGIKSEDGTMDLAVLDRTIKDLRKEASGAAKGQVAPDISDANRNRILKNLVNARNKFLAKQEPEVSTALAEAEAETARHHSEFDRSFVGNFLVKDDNYGGMRIADPKLLDQIMRNEDKVGAKQLADLVNGVPAAKKAIVDYANAYYQKGFTKLLKNGDRILDARKHQLFVEKVLPTIKPFLDKADLAEFRTLGGIAKNAVRQQERWDSAQDAWKTTDQGKLGQKLTNETFVNSFFQPAKSAATVNYAFIKNKLGNDALEKTRAGIMAELVSRSRDPVSQRLSLGKLSTEVFKVQDRMKLYFGKETVDRINNLVKVAQADNIDQIGKATLSGNTPLSEASKVVLGPLSAENRKIQFLKNLRLKNTAARLEAALYDPKELPRLIEEIEGRRIKTAIKSGISVGASASTNDYGFND